MSRYRDSRRRWLASFRPFGVLLLDLIANSGVYLIPPPWLSAAPAPGAVPLGYGAAVPEAGPASPDVAFAPLTADECRAWERLVRELGGEPRGDRPLDSGGQ
jgi:hypothetical protein